MKTIKLAIAFIIGTALFSACTKPLPFQGEYVEPKLVVNCIAMPDEPIKAYVYKSDFVYDTITDYDIPEGTQVFLYVNGESKGEMWMDADTNYYAHYIHPVVSQYFTSDYIPQIGDVVKISVTAPGFDDIEGSSEPLPNEPFGRIADSRVTKWDTTSMKGFRVSIPDTDTFEVVWLREYRKHITVALEVTDPNPGLLDYYCLEASLRIDGDWTYPDGSEMDYNVGELERIYFNDPIIGTSTAELEDQFGINVGLGNRSKSTFNDATFDGGSYRLEIPMVTSTLFKANDSISAYVDIRLRHLTEGAYNYFSTITSGSAYSQYYSEPVSVYSNVKNGFGLVAGSNDAVVSFSVW
jgi:hypothetical protein